MEDSAAAPESSSSGRVRSAGPVRVVARIFPGDAGGGSFKVAARVQSSSAVVSVSPLHEDRTPRPGAPALPKADEYMVDSCYLKDSKEGDCCQQIYLGEVKPLVDAMFRGINSCVIACGALSKTELITAPPARLLTMALEQIFLLSQPISAAVSFSRYQVLHDTHVFDLLDPKDKDVPVLEDADRRTHLKGISKVRIKSTEEFADLCCRGTSMLKHPVKPSNRVAPRAEHHGFIIYVSTLDQKGKECLLGKMNFLDLAGYVDPKERSDGGCLAQSNCNKSLHALVDVAKALNSNQSFIPYRQSKLTHILQDFLCKTNSAVLIACLDEVSTQDAVSTLSLASRSSQVVNEPQCNLSLGTTRSSSKANASLSASSKNLSRSLLPSIHQSSSALYKHIQPQLNNSASRTPAAYKRSKVEIDSAKKPISLFSTYAKQRGVKSSLNGRKLFGPGTNLSKDDKIFAAPAEDVKSSSGMETQGSLPAEDMRILELLITIYWSNVQGFDEAEKVRELLSCSMQQLASSSVQEDVSLSGLSLDHSFTNLETMCPSDIDGCVVDPPVPVSATQSSPKLSHQLKEMSDTLKLLSTRPGSALDYSKGSSEAETPVVHLKCGHAEDSHELLKAHGSGVQNTLAKGCLAFLNSADEEQLKSLKGIGEKRANYILELRAEDPPTLFKEVDDLKTLIGMNSKEIKTLMSQMVMMRL